MIIIAYPQFSKIILILTSKTNRLLSLYSKKKYPAMNYNAEQIDLSMACQPV